MGWFVELFFVLKVFPSLKLSAKAPGNGWLEDERSYLDGLFSGTLLDLGRVTVGE